MIFIISEEGEYKKNTLEKISDDKNIIQNGEIKKL